MKFQGLMLALCLGAAACGGQANPETQSTLAPLALWQGSDAVLAGTYDLNTSKLELTADAQRAMVQGGLRLVRPGTTQAIPAGEKLVIGDALEIVNGEGAVMGTLIVEDVSWVDTLGEEARSVWAVLCADFGLA